MSECWIPVYGNRLWDHIRYNVIDMINIQQQQKKRKDENDYMITEIDQVIVYEFNASIQDCNQFIKGIIIVIRIIIAHHQ